MCQNAETALGIYRVTGVRSSPFRHKAKTHEAVSVRPTALKHKPPFRTITTNHLIINYSVIDRNHIQPVESIAPGRENERVTLCPVG